MKFFTVKDFIEYNNPCRLCGEYINFTLYQYNKNIFSHIRAEIKNNSINFVLFVKYKEDLNLSIDYKTNKYTLYGHCNIGEAFENYLDNNQLSLYSNCKKCNTSVSSTEIVFENDYIKPVQLYSEFVRTQNYKFKYIIYSSYEQNISYITILKNKNKFNLTVPLISLARFKNKEELVKKLNLYMILD